MFPSPIFKLSDGYRWYCAAEIHGYSRLVKSAGLRPGRYSEGEKRTIWLKRNTFAFKSKLETILKNRIGEVPRALADEDEIMSALKKEKKLNLTESDVLKLIQQ